MGLSNAERQRRYIARLKERAKQGTDKPAKPDTKPEWVKSLQPTVEEENEILKNELHLARKALAAAKKERPAPATGSDDPRIARLQNRNKELRGELHELKKWYASSIAKKGGMNRDTFNAVVKCLHPDERKKRSEKEIDEACGLFTQWKKDRDKA